MQTKTSTTEPQITLDDLAWAATLLRRASDAAERRIRHADRNRLVLIAVRQGLHKAAIARTAEIHESTINDIVRRERLTSPEGRHARLEQVTLTETTLGSGAPFTSVKCSQCGSGRLYPREIAATAASIHRHDATWALDEPATY